MSTCSDRDANCCTTHIVIILQAVIPISSLSSMYNFFSINQILILLEKMAKIA